MAIDIKPIDPVGRPFFAGVVTGIDLTKPPSVQDVAAVHDGMDKFGVLVFHGQPINDDQQLVFSRALGGVSGFALAGGCAIVEIAAIGIVAILAA